MAMATRWLEINIKLVLLAAIPLLLGRINYQLQDNAFSFCLFKNITGKNCYGCGLLRGISALLHADFVAIVQLNHLNIITIPMLVYLYLKQAVGIVYKAVRSIYKEPPSTKTDSSVNSCINVLPDKQPIIRVIASLPSL